MESQLVPVVKVALAVNETAAPLVVVTGTDCGANELPANPRNSSNGTVDIKSGNAERFRTTATLAGATPALLNAMLPRYCPAAKPDGLISTVTVGGALPEAELPDVGETESHGLPESAVAVHESVPVPAFGTSTTRVIGVVEPVAAFTTTAADVSANSAGVAATTVSVTPTV
jgi:hypothetical protein